MKIRTDFVTNSSSSSFVASFKIELEDGTDIKGAISEDSGDYEAVSSSLNEEEISWDEMYEEFFDDEDCEESEESHQIQLFSQNMNLADLLDDINKEDFINTISTWLKVYEDEDDYDYEDEDDDEETRKENSADKYNNKIKKDLEELVKTTKIKNAEVSYEYGGRGEGLYFVTDFLSHNFDYDLDRKIEEILKSEDNVFDKLRKLKCLKKYTDESINNMIEACKYDYPCDFVVTEKLNDKGLVDLSFDINKEF